MKKSGSVIACLLVMGMLLSLILGGCGGNTAETQSTKAQSTTANQTTVKETEKTAAAQQPSAANAKKLRLSWTVAYDKDHPYTIAAETVKSVLEEQTKGAITVDLFPGGQLGGDADLFQAVQLGSIDIVVLSAPVIAATTPVLTGADMPYLFNYDYDLMYQAESGPAGQKLLKRLEEEVKGIKALSFLYQPFRHIMTVKEIKSIADMKGLKFRTMQSPVHVEIFKALGMNPTPVPFNDVYTSLQSKVVDGHESDVIGTFINKFHEVAKYITISGHFNNAVVLLISEKTYNSMTPDEQKAMQDAAAAAAKATMDGTKRAEEQYMEKLKQGGAVVSNVITQEELAKATEGVLQKYYNEIPEVKEFVDAVRALKK